MENSPCCLLSEMETLNSVYSDDFNLNNVKESLMSFGQLIRHLSEENNSLRMRIKNSEASVDELRKQFGDIAKPKPDKPIWLEELKQDMLSIVSEEILNVKYMLSEEILNVKYMIMNPQSKCKLSDETANIFKLPLKYNNPEYEGYIKGLKEKILNSCSKITEYRNERLNKIDETINKQEQFSNQLEKRVKEIEMLLESQNTRMNDKFSFETCNYFRKVYRDENISSSLNGSCKYPVYHEMNVNSVQRGGIKKLPGCELNCVGLDGIHSETIITKSCLTIPNENEEKKLYGDCTNCVSNESESSEDVVCGMKLSNCTDNQENKTLANDLENSIQCQKYFQKKNKYTESTLFGALQASKATANDVSVSDTKITDPVIVNWFQWKLQRRKVTATEIIHHSIVFLTGNPGYRIQFRAQIDRLHGDVYFSVRVLKGPFDEKLNWPFQQKFFVRLSNKMKVVYPGKWVLPKEKMWINELPRPINKRDNVFSEWVGPFDVSNFLEKKQILLEFMPISM